MFGKVVGSILGARIAERSGKSGVLGGAAGLVASGFLRRSPMAALLVGGAWLGHKLYRRNQEREANVPRAPDVPVAAGEQEATPPSLPRA